MDQNNFLKLFLFWIGAPADNTLYPTFEGMEETFLHIQEMREKLYEWIFDESIPPISLSFVQPQQEKKTSPVLQEKSPLEILQNLLSHLKMKLVELLRTVNVLR